MATNRPVTSSGRVSPVSVSRSVKPGDLALAVDLGDFAVEGELDLRVVEGALLHHLAGAQAVATVDDRDLGGEPRQERRLLHRGVAAADHGDRMVLEEEAVAGGAGRDAASEQVLLAVEAEVAVGGTGGDDDGLGLVDGAVVERHDLRIGRQVDRDRVVDDEAGTEALRLRLHVIHQLGSHDPLGEPGEVLDLGGRHQRAAGGDRTLDDERLELGPRGVERRRVAGRTGTDDDDLLDRASRVAHRSTSRAGFAAGCRQRMLASRCSPGRCRRC